MEQFLTVLSVVSTVCAIVFGYAAFARNRKSDTESEAKNDATVLTEIGYIKAVSYTHLTLPTNREV